MMTGILEMQVLPADSLALHQNVSYLHLPESVLCGTISPA